MWKRQSLMLSLEVFSLWNVLDSLRGEEGTDRTEGEKDKQAEEVEWEKGGKRKCAISKRWEGERDERRSREEEEKRANEASKSSVTVWCSVRWVSGVSEWVSGEIPAAPELLLSPVLFCQIKEAGTCIEPAALRHLPQAVAPPSHRGQRRGAVQQLSVSQTWQPTTEA